MDTSIKSLQVGEAVQTFRQLFKTIGGEILFIIIGSAFNLSFIVSSTISLYFEVFSIIAYLCLPYDIKACHFLLSFYEH